jgi:hypothetical protein
MVQVCSGCKFWEVICPSAYELCLDRGELQSLCRQFKIPPEPKDGAELRGMQEKRRVAGFEYLEPISFPFEAEGYTSRVIVAEAGDIMYVAHFNSASNLTEVPIQNNATWDMALCLYTC